MNNELILSLLFEAAEKYLQLYDLEHSENSISNGIKYMKLGNDYTNQETAHLGRITAYYTAMIP